MPSEQNNGAMESKEIPLKWIADQPASESDQKAFWKKLRHFYRTGEKPNVDSPKNLKSVFWSVLQADAPYPFEIGNHLVDFGSNVLGVSMYVSQKLQNREVGLL